ncbi:MAG: YncE family protein [Gemmatimonadaceae bacterium]
MTTNPGSEMNPIIPARNASNVVRNALVVAALLVVSVTARAQLRTCIATASSLTPTSWQSPPDVAKRSSKDAELAASSSLDLIADVPLPGAAKRFDYQSFDSTTGRLYISHMRGDRLDVFDTRGDRLVASLEGFPGATGVWAVPALHKLYVSVTNEHEVVVLDDRSLAVLARVLGADFPDGIAYAPDERQLFVSDEHGGNDLVIDGMTNARLGVIPLGGEAGNTHYDDVSHCVLVAVQTTNDLVAIDPFTHHVVVRYPMACDHPHGFLIDEPHRLAFVTCEGDSKLLVVDLRTMRTTASMNIPAEPDVLAFDPGLQRLYVACESGSLAMFEERRASLVPLREYRAPHAHTVAVDPATHRIYLPLQDVEGKPRLRILSPSIHHGR